ncbi:hypothetical protein NKH77_39050 [Streptomyces sp. M19]
MKITNPESSTYYYTLFVGFVDGDEKVITTGIESDAAVPGNGTKTVKVIGMEADSSQKAKKCRVSLATKSETADS